MEPVIPDASRFPRAIGGEEPKPGDFYHLLERMAVALESMATTNLEQLEISRGTALGTLDITESVRGMMSGLFPKPESEEES